MVNAKRVAVYSIVAVLAALNVWQFALRRAEQDVPFPFAGLQPRLRSPEEWPSTEGAHLLPEKYKLNDEQQKIVDDFHKLFYGSTASWDDNRWLGFECLQNPNDVWMTQEILQEVKPDLIIETGTYKGGSAILWSSLLQLIKPEAQVITIDIVGDPSAAARQHPLFQQRGTFILGSSTSRDVVNRVRELARGKKTLVILDSDHRAEHVLAELRTFKDIVSPGSYIIVQDTNVNGHPVLAGYGPGPMEAVQQFLSETKEFVADRSRERLLFTLHPSGYLKRQS